jgi:hypothetical protein
MRRRIGPLVGMVVMMGMANALGQSVTDARRTGMASYGAAVDDVRDFNVNPAGLVGMRDWDFTTSTYLSPTTGEKGFVFHGLSFGKRIGERGAVGLQYSPGTQVRFVVPPTITLPPGGTPSSSDRQLEYSEPFSLGVAYRFLEEASLGLGARVRREGLTETLYELVIEDTVAYPVVTIEESKVTSWNLDASILVDVAEGVRLGLVGRNLLHLEAGTPSDSLGAYRLPKDPLGELSIAARPHPAVLLTAELTTELTGALGMEWDLGKGVALRGGVYLSEDERPATYAMAAGLGWNYEFLELGASYLHFFDQTLRGGSGEAAAFDPSAIRTIDLGPYSADRVQLSLKAMFGRVREQLAVIEAVELHGAVYPSSASLFSINPIGKAAIANVSDRPLQAKVAFFVEGYMDVPTESRPVYLQPGQRVEVPLLAVFNERIGAVSSLTVKEADVTVEASPAEQVDDRYQTRLLIQGRNAWDGDVLTLRYFVTPDHPEVIRYSRDVLLQHRDSLSGGPGGLEQFSRAKVIFNAFAGNLVYVRDPKQSTDYVQYPAETLGLRGGDCDDLTVCFASLLSSIGIATAFVDVLPPENPEQGHIYLLFDTGLAPQFGASIAGNAKRYVVRTDQHGMETIWIPVETTAIAEGFERAWELGAEEYLRDAEMGMGLIRGWVRIVDLQ